MSTIANVDPDYDIEKPLLKDGKWLIFNNAIFSKLDTIDCNDTIESNCYKDKTFDECINICNSSTQCAYGYYLSNNNINYCVPIRDLKINSNPVYRLRKKDIYPELKHSIVKTFINRDKYYFPPVQANTVFFLDNLLIQNTETSTILQTSPIIDSSYSDNNNIKFHKTGNVIVQPIEIPPNLSAEHYITLKYGNNFSFNIPDTNLLIKDLNGLKWKSTSFMSPVNTTFYLDPLTPGKKIGDDVYYSDIFNIRSSSSSLLGISPDYIIQNQTQPHNSTFRFIPKMIGFYCNNDNKCTPISLEEMVIDEKGIGRKDGLAVGRNPGCWGVCKYKVHDKPLLKPLDIYKESHTRSTPLIIFFSLFFILLIIACIYIIIKK